MPAKKLDQLISTLNESFGDGQASPEQEELLEKVKAHIHDEGEPDFSDPTLKDTIELLFESIREEHPSAAAIARDLLNHLGNMGV